MLARTGVLGGLSDAAGADGTRLGGLGTLTVSPNKALEIRVLGALQAQLLAPGGGNHRRGQTLVWADQDVGLALGYVAQAFDLVLGKARGTLSENPGPTRILAKEQPGPTRSVDFREFTFYTVGG